MSCPPEKKLKLTPRIKTTQSQYNLMVNFISDHPEMISGKLNEKFKNKDRHRLWAELTNLLNAEGLGPQKSPSKWRKTWSDYKTDVKQKASDFRRLQNETGGGPPPAPLNEIQEKAANLIGAALIEGHEDCIEPFRLLRIEQNQTNGDVCENEENAETQVLDVQIIHDTGNCSVNDIQWDAIGASTSSGKAGYNNLLDDSDTNLIESTPIGNKRRRHRKKSDDSAVPAVERNTEALNRLTDAIENFVRCNETKNSILERIANSLEAIVEKIQ